MNNLTPFSGVIFLLILIFLLATRPAPADPLDDGANICKQHMNTPPPPPPGTSVPASSQFSKPEPGWEHCPEIIRQWTDRKMAVDAVDESKNPDLAMTRNLARGLAK